MPTKPLTTDIAKPTTTLIVCRLSLFILAYAAFLTLLDSLAIINAGSLGQCLFALLVLLVPGVVVEKRMTLSNFITDDRMTAAEAMTTTDLIWYPRGIEIDDLFVEELRGD